MIDVANDDAVYYYHFDGVGSVIALSDVNSLIVERYSYDVFGEPNRTSDVNNPYFFTGRRYDGETDLYYYRARYYDYCLGRFLQTDPLGYRDSWNLYEYCLNNPIFWFDPFGLKIKIVGDKAAVEEAEKYLLKSETFKKTYKYLESRKETYVIKTINNHKDKYNLQTNTVHWDPTSALKLTSGGTQSPALGLAHELEHARNDAEGDIDMTPTKNNYHYIEEKNVITGPEAQMAKDLGESIRTDHQGTAFRVRTPIERKKAKSKGTK